ncbi:MAG: YpmA family protein [Syntrophomonadaceae bacterium]|nr:YpmA family protein [Syntrophomonadaceae bacterium]
MGAEEAGKMELLAKKTFNGSPELIKAVDFLNKTLKSKKVMFGLSKDRETGKMTLSIYEV